MLQYNIFCYCHAEKNINRERERKIAPVIYILHQLIAVLIAYNYILLERLEKYRAIEHCKKTQAVIVLVIDSSPIDLCKMNCRTNAK